MTINYQPNNGCCGPQYFDSLADRLRYQTNFEKSCTAPEIRNPLIIDGKTHNTCGHFNYVNIQDQITIQNNKIFNNNDKQI